MKGALCLIENIWVGRAIVKWVIEATMAKIWHINLKAVFYEVGSNIFIISFSIHVDKYHVEEGKPWLFENNLFAIEPGRPILTIKPNLPRGTESPRRPTELGPDRKCHCPITPNPHMGYMLSTLAQGSRSPLHLMKLPLHL